MQTSAYLFAEHPAWSVFFWTSYASFFFVSSWVHRRDAKGQRGENRDRGSKIVIYVFSMGGSLAAFVIPAFHPELRILLPHEALFFGAMAVFWAGLLLYVWAVRTLGEFFRTSVTLLDGQKLVTRGPYRLLRHPAYTGGILLFSGAGLATGNWASAAVAAGAVAAGYIWRIRVEERALLERFGAAFEARRRQTWAVIPLLW
ncbi:MAG: isoprenylcysteine carboxylmethyltransferase family protein [Alphaproteobacteria bacterium]|nr:isoprenylcysteine carboxylmethyltransferase family protein [Alphaproteobacteria bacterium]